MKVALLWQEVFAGRTVESGCARVVGLAFFARVRVDQLLLGVAATYFAYLLKLVLYNNFYLIISFVLWRRRRSHDAWI